MPPVNLIEGGAGVCAAKGFLAAGISAGLKASGKLDLALVFSETPAGVAGVFTTNLACAAPVVVSRERAASGAAQAVVVNSGGANACTGDKGLEDARQMARSAAGVLGISEESVLVCSTGLIGSYLPMDKIVSGIGVAAGSLSPDDEEAARAIMTTDTVPKTACLKHDQGWSIGGMAKGAGMIAPNMATMLAFVTTDARVAPDALSSMLKRVVEDSFNAVTVDGDTSTNDTALVFANGASGVDPDPGEFEGALALVCKSLARQIVADGEGATKLVSVQIRGAATTVEARKAARTVADSLLVKTMVYGGDANWGRVAGAVGRAGVAVDFDCWNIEICGVPLVVGGVAASSDQVDAARKAMLVRNISIGCDLGVGDASAEVLTTDLTPEYVTFNAEYEL